VFVFDDFGSIHQNESIRKLWSPGRVLGFRGGTTSAGRPLVNLSLAINYALGGTNPAGYHVVNIIIHALAGLTLFGVLRRTFRLPSLRNTPVSRASTVLACAIALLWIVHPLQTGSVTYIVQRAEALAGLFYLLVFYCALRSTTGWRVLAVLAALLGVATKETVATAPILVLLFDRLFLAGSFQELFRRRWGLYAGLAASWVLLATLMWLSVGRQGTVGFNLDISPWEYARTQPYYIVRYLWLAFWPGPLVFDYGYYVAKTQPEILPHVLIVLALLTGLLAAWRRNSKLAFCGVWFFLILAPTSSFVPVATQTGAEHRMYLPLAGLITLVVIGAYRLLERRLAVAGLVVVALALGGRTIARNRDYHSELALWQDTVNKRPDNYRARSTLATYLAGRNRQAEAITELQEALRLNPRYAPAYNNLGHVFLRQGKLNDAVTQFREALRWEPARPETRYGLGNALTQQGNFGEAIIQFEIADRLRAELDADARYNWGVSLLQLGRDAEAIVHFRKAIALNPSNAPAHNNLGVALLLRGERDEAVRRFQEAVRLKPDYADARENLSNTLAAVRDTKGD
jgi:Flp pilus assembly protein TadD